MKTLSFLVYVISRRGNHWCFQLVLPTAGSANCLKQEIIYMPLNINLDTFLGKVHLQVKLETESSKEICITNLWSCDFRKEVYKGMRCLYKKNNFIVPLYGQGSTASRLYGHYKETIYFLPQVPRNLWYSIDQPLKEENLSKIRVKILWFRTRYHWIGNPVT